jgi:hypothetical protein
MATRRLVMARLGERRVRAGTGAVVAVAALAAVTLAAPRPAGAGGGDLLYPDRDRYEVGQQVRLVGYTQALARSALDEQALTRVDLQRNGPYFAYLRVDPAAVERDASQEDDAWSYAHPTDLQMGPVAADEMSPAEGAYSLRVSATFRLPRDLAPGVYDVSVCNDPCTTTLGWLFSSPVHVGVDPAGPIVRAWPLDEPAIRYLADDALVWDPTCEANCDDIVDWSVTAAQIRAGYRPTPVTVAPEPEPAARTATTDPPAGRPVAGAGESPAGTAGTDPPGGVPSEIVAWVTGFGVLLVVWCLAWRLRPREARMVVRQGNGQHDHGSSDDDPNTVHIKL